MSLQLQAGRELFIDPEPYLLESGQVLSGLDIVHEIHGPAGAPLVAVLGGISAGAHSAAHRDDPQPGWWEGIVGPGCAIDSDRYRVLGIEFAGGPGCPMRLGGGHGIGRITPRDQARILVRLLRGLDLGGMHALIGASYGGMVGLAIASEAPLLLRRLCVISAAHRPDAWAQALRTQQRRILRLGRGSGRQKDALALARSLAMLSYRSPAEFEERFDTRPQAASGLPRFESEAYLESCGRRFAESFDPDSYVLLSQAIDLHEVDPVSIGTPTLLISTDSDLIVPSALVDQLHRGLPLSLGHHRIGSIHGHDAFLKEEAALTPLLRAFLSGGAS